jgi:tight adherence protein B
MDAVSQLLAALTFVLVLGIVLGVYWLAVAKPEWAEDRALKRRMQARPAAVRSSSAGLLREVERLSSISGLDRVLAHAERVTRPLQRRLSQSGVAVTVGTFLLLSAFLGVLGYWIVVRNTHSVPAGLVVALLTGWLPFGYLQVMWHRRLVRFESQFPEAMDLVARALRAGHAFTTGLRMAGEELPDPVGAEFRLLHDRQNFGLSLPDALREFAARIPIVDARFFVTAVLTQRETGGNLAEVLDHLASVIRERFRVRRDVRVKSAHGRASGYVIAAMPPALAFVMWYVRPEQITKLLNDPLGIRMVIAAAVLQLMGVLVIRRIVDIDY